MTSTLVLLFYNILFKTFIEHKIYATTVRYVTWYQIVCNSKHVDYKLFIFIVFGIIKHVV